MNSLELFQQYFNRDDINHYGKGRMGLSIAATARILCVNASGLGRAIGVYKSADRLSIKLDAKLESVGFSAFDRDEWSKTGIPDIALGVIGKMGLKPRPSRTVFLAL